MSTVDQMDVESRPIKWIFDEFKKGNLFVDNTFQRKYVWMSKDKVSLVETIILGYPIPEVYLWQTGTDPNTGDTKYSIIDGQQRIRAIVDYLESRYKLNPAGLEFEEANYLKKEFLELNPEQKSAFWGHKISIRFVKERVDRESIIKMFLRLNKTSNALNPQELRNAEFNGEFIKAAVAVAGNDFWRVCGVFSESDIRRMIDVQFASTLLMFVKSGFEDETTQTAINKFYDLYNESYPSSIKDIELISTVVDIVSSLRNKNTSLISHFKKKTHLYTVFNVIYSFHSGLNPSNRSYDEVSDLLAKWFDYLDGTSDIDEKFKKDANEYRSLSQEGVQKKANRLRRYEILSKYLTSE